VIEQPLHDLAVDCFSDTPVFAINLKSGLDR
jgi:hypothetical protein